MKDISQKYGLSLEQVAQLRSQEIKQMLLRGRKPSKSILNERLHGFIFLPQKTKMGKILVGEDYLAYKQKLEPKHLQELSGRVAYPGKVSGMTNPQIVPYLKNAVAIVTDE